MGNENPPISFSARNPIRRSCLTLPLALSCQSLHYGYFGDVVVVAPLTGSPPLINGEIAFRLDGGAGSEDLVACWVTVKGE